MKSKFKILFVLPLVAAALSSCLESKSNYTPSITVFRPILCTHPSGAGQDTLSATHNSATGYYQIDTVSAGDTVRMRVCLNSYANNLTKFDVSYDSTVLDLTLHIDSIRMAFDLDKSTNSHLEFKPGFNMAFFPLEYVAKRHGASRIEMHLESDSEMSPADAGFYQVVD